MNQKGKFQIKIPRNLYELPSRILFQSGLKSPMELPQINSTPQTTRNNSLH